MGALGLAQPLALSSPLTTTQFPFPLFVNGNEIHNNVDVVSYRLTDAGFGSTQLLDFTISDPAGTIDTWLDTQQKVIWYDAVNSRYLFQGYTKNLHPRVGSVYQEIDVTCVDLSEALDYARPIISVDNAQHGSTDAAMIGSLVGTYSQEMHLGSGGFIQVLNGSMTNSLVTERMTLRNAIDAVLQATGATGAVAYVDSLGYLHTLTSGDLSAPYSISDTPNGTTSVGAMIDPRTQGSEDVDALYVYGNTPAGTGPVYAWQCGITTPPRSPLRWAVLDDPTAVDAASARRSATREFGRRSVDLTATLTVTGYDGWAKGQIVSVTNSVLGWSNKLLTISAVNMRVLAGNGKREYTIAAGNEPIVFTAHIRKFSHLLASGLLRAGQLGGATRFAGAG